MVDAARQMLDELMGRNRNLHPSEAGLKVNWEDPEFCQFYNVKFCPHDLFINTRADLGPCARIHDDEAKHLYMEARPSQRKRQYEDEFLRFCNVMLHDVDRKIQKGKQRLQLMQSDQPVMQMTTQISKFQEHLNKLNARIKKLLSEAEEAGIRGDVDQAQDLMTICEELREEKEALQNQNETALRSTGALPSAPPPPTLRLNELSGTPSDLSDGGTMTDSMSAIEGIAAGVSGSVDGTNTESNEAEDSMSDDNDKKSHTSNWTHDLNVPEKQMKVCDICGAFLIVGDAQQRIEDHLMGKQHLGYSKLRNAVAEINEKRQKEREEDERRRRDERTQRGNTFDNRRSNDQRDFRERSREHSTSSSSRHHSDKHRYHHKSHHRNTHSHNSRTRNHQHYHHESRDRYSRSRSRSRY